MDREQFAAFVVAGADVLFAGCAVMHGDVELGCEPFALSAPVTDDAQRADDEVWAGAFEQVGQRGRRLAEPHIVGQHATEAEFGEKLQPGQAAALVVAQLATKLR